MKNKQYDAMVVFDFPIHIADDDGDVFSIYGLLYNKKKKHNDDLWTWVLNRYICYLQGCERVQSNGCKLAPELLITNGGHTIPLNVRLKNTIYRIIKKDMIEYRIIEPIEPIEIHADEVDDNLIISQELLLRIHNNIEKE